MIDLANVRQPAVAPYTICEILSLASSNGGLACARCATGALLARRLRTVRHCRRNGRARHLPRLVAPACAARHHSSSSSSSSASRPYESRAARPLPLPLRPRRDGGGSGRPMSGLSSRGLRGMQVSSIDIPSSAGSMRPPRPAPPARILCVFWQRLHAKQMNAKTMVIGSRKPQPDDFRSGGGGVGGWLSWGS